MILYFVTALTISVWGAELTGGIKDLGVLSPTTKIPLMRNTTRDDFNHFEVEVAPSWDTNRVVKFNTTNDFLDLSHLQALPSGRMLLGLKSVNHEGLESPVSVFIFTIWRSETLPAPTAGTVVRHHNWKGTNQIGGGDSLVRAFGRLRASSTNRSATLPPPPPLPPGISINRATGFPGPMPNGKPETYAQHLDADAEKKMLEFYSRTGRRNQ